MSSILKKELFIEFEDKHLIFLAAEFTENNEIKILDKKISNIEEIKEGYISNLDSIINLIQNNLNEIEKKLTLFLKM